MKQKRMPNNLRVRPPPPRLYLQQWDGARFFADARHHSGRTTRNRGNRMSLAAMERSQVKTDGHRRWTWPPFRFNGGYFGAVAETNDKHGAAVTSIGNTT